MAWGKKGHELVAQVAFHYLDDATKKNVLQYLDGMSIEQAANWMDAIKKNHANDFMKPYHYADMEQGTNTILEGDNIITILTTTLRELDHKETLSHDEIKKRILFLFHLIGDLHQPLHIGYSSDKGGNKVQLLFRGRKKTNLHSVWDTEIIKYKKIDSTAVLKSRNYTAQDLVKVKKINIIKWAKQSRAYLKKVYDFNNEEIDDNYIESNYPIIENQLLDAGIRLAAILEKYFKTAS
jgi:hypothetical protein